jgi:outer membrane protein assembly factor BamD (BamD/ComL family)
MVIDARRALHAGDFATTLRLLDAAAATFPSGTLAQEREALAIQALARSGQREAAAKRAATFLAKHPESPHAADLKAFAR